LKNPSPLATCETSDAKTTAPSVPVAEINLASWAGQLRNDRLRERRRPPRGSFGRKQIESGHGALSLWLVVVGKLQLGFKTADIISDKAAAQGEQAFICSFYRGFDVCLYEVLWELKIRFYETPYLLISGRSMRRRRARDIAPMTERATLFL
jgi:hypothetical protein